MIPLDAPLARDDDDQLLPEGKLPRVDDADAPATALRWPRDTRDRKLVYTVIVETREGWQRAYDQLPERPGDRAITRLNAGLQARAGVPSPA